MAVDGPQVDRTAGAAPRTEDIQPRSSGDQRSPNCGRPQHVAASGKASIPAIDDKLRLEARGAVRLQLGGASLDVEPSCSDAHGASIMGSAGEVDPYAFLRPELLHLPQHEWRALPARTLGPLPGRRQPFPVEFAHELIAYQKLRQTGVCPVGIVKG
jgi:hypothetical protein